jgi:hypothetical protein
MLEVMVVQVEVCSLLVVQVVVYSLLFVVAVVVVENHIGSSIVLK